MVAVGNEASQCRLGDQADRAVSFWDSFYRSGGQAVAALEFEPEEECGVIHTSGSSGSGSGGPVEWVLEPQVVLPGVLRVLDGRQMRPKRILEIGCGESALAELLHAALEGQTEVTAVDISEVALANARRRAADNAVGGEGSNLRFMRADVTNLRDLYEDGSLDVVIDKGMQDTLQFRARTTESKTLLANLFAEVFRVLSPGGCYVIASPKPRIRYLRTVGWDRIDREALAVGSARLEQHQDRDDRKSSDDTCYIHVCLKPTEKYLLEMDTLSANKAAQAELEDEHCSGCGAIRSTSRYRSERSWTRHVEFCAGG